jgi:non-homologous end joining protein Ku
MAPRAYWKRSLKFPLVSYPIAFYPPSMPADGKAGGRLRGDLRRYETEGKGGAREGGAVEQGARHRAEASRQEPAGHHAALSVRTQGRRRLRRHSEPGVSKDMVGLAAHLLNTKASKLNPDKCKDECETALKAMVKRKAAGKTIEVPEAEEEESNVIDLMDGLKQSLEGRKLAKATRKAKWSRRRGRKSKTA